MSTDPAWREVEKLVARMDRVLSPMGAIVRSPDFVRDNVTGEQREVDASIRSSPNDAPIRVIECRDGAKVEDVTWIEQLIAKSRDHGVPTVAVSSAGFSSAARAKAARYGIETRRIDEVTQDQVSGWTRIRIENRVVFPEIANVNMAGYWDTDDADVAIHPKVMEQLAAERGNAAVFKRLSDGRLLRVFELLDAALRRELDLFPDVPKDGSTVERVVRLNFTRGLLCMETTVGTRDVSRITLTVTVRTERVPNKGEGVPLRRVNSPSRSWAANRRRCARKGSGRRVRPAPHVAHSGAAPDHTAHGHGSYESCATVCTAAAACGRRRDAEKHEAIH